MFREQTDAALRTLLMVVAAFGLVASIASPIAIRANRAAVHPGAAASPQVVRPAQQDYNGSRRNHVVTASLSGLSFVADDVTPAVERSR
jgi:hypothetical protein